MYTALVVLLVLDAVALIALILLQQGKGADAGAAFGSGASGTVFGSRGSAGFLSHLTAWLAGAFFVLTLALGYLVHGGATGESVIKKIAEQQKAAATQSKPAPKLAPAAPQSAAPKLAAPPVTPAKPSAPASNKSS